VEGVSIGLSTLGCGNIQVHMLRYARFASGADERPPLQIRLSLGGDGANQNGMAGEGSCDTRPFSSERLQGLGVAL
jgi:hypothetical protein